MNYYEILGVPVGATQKEIKQAYRKKAIEIHPDKLNGATAQSLRQLAEERLKELNLIYEVLSEPSQRDAYNQSLKGDRKEELLKEITYFCELGELEQAVAIAKNLYGLFPEDAECGDILAEVQYALAVALSESLESHDIYLVETYLKQALAVVHSRELRAQIEADLALLQHRKTTAAAEQPHTSSTTGDETITTARAVRLLQAGEAGIRAWNLFRQCETYVPDLSGVDLSGADLSETNLQGVKLHKAKLAGVQLTGSNLDGTDLSEADLSGAIADQASFVGANLDSVQWIDGSFKGTDFSEAQFNKATLNHANGQQAIFCAASLQQVQWIEGNLDDTHCHKANFSGAILTNTKAKKSIFTEVTLANAHWENANLSDTDFSGADLGRAELTNANLQGTTFTQAQLVGTNLNGSNIASGKSYSYHHVGIDFADSDLSCATLIGVNLCKSNFSNAKLQNTKFDHADLGGCSLANAAINNTSLLGTNLRDADLTGTKFYFAYVDIETNISGAKGI